MPGKDEIHKDIVKTISEWKKYKPKYEATVTSSDDHHVYSLEQKAVGIGRVAVPWIARVLRTELGYDKNVVDQHISPAIDKLAAEGTIDVITTGPLDPRYRPQDGPLYKTLSTARKGVKLAEKKPASN